MKLIRITKRNLLGFVLNKPVYPTRLLPCPNIVDNFKYDDDCFLIRRSSYPQDLIFDEDGELRLEAIEIDKLFGYSVNLIFCDVCQNCSQLSSNYNDVKFRITNKDLSEYWVPNNSSIPFIDLNDYEYIDNGVFLLRIKEVNTIEGEYPFSKGNKAKTTHKFVVYSVHKPTKSNFFHFEFACNGNHENTDGLCDTKIEKFSSSGYKNAIAHAISVGLKEIITKKHQEDIFQILKEN